MRCRIAILTDLHYSVRDRLPERKGTIGDTLLGEAAERVNADIRPDAVVFLGDLLDDGTAPEATDLRRQLAEVFARFDAPVFIVPGNHDGPAAAFYDDLPMPPDVIALGGRRFAFFDDAEEPGFNARRRGEDLARMARLRERNAEPLVLCQHVPLFPPPGDECPYGFVNADEIFACLKGVAAPSLLLGGHYHRGAGPVRHSAGISLAAPALCEAPFPFLVADLDGTDELRLARIELRP